MLERVLASTSTQIPFQAVSPNVFRKQILRFGRWIHPSDANQFLEITPEFADQLIANYKAGVFGHVTVPLGHNEDDPNVNTGDVIDLEKGSDGIYAVIKFLRDDTVDSIKRKLIKDVSVGISGNYQHKETGKFVGPVLRHLALTNCPYIKNMRGFEPIQPIKVTAADPAFEVLLFSEDANMNLEQLIAELKKQGIDVRDLEAQLATQKTSNTALLSEKTVLEKQVADLTTEKTTLLSEKTTLTTEVADLKKKAEPATIELSDTKKNLTTVTVQLSDANKTIATMQKEKTHGEAVAKVEKLIHDGKLAPTQKEAYINLAEKSPEAFEAIASTMPKLIDMKERGASGEDQDGPLAEMSEDDAQKHVDRIAETLLKQVKK